ncbi:MAG: hypothetical protein ACR2HX_19425 [Pyrinomonadaceae bacterium]
MTDKNQKPLTLEDQLEKATSELQTLREEQSAISERMATAGRDGDADTILDLQRRSDALPTQLLGASAKALRLRIQCLEAELPELIEEERVQAEAAAQAQSLANEARLKAEEANRQYLAAYEEKHIVVLAIGEKRRDLDRVVASLTRPPAPVVRSRIHAFSQIG